MRARLDERRLENLKKEFLSAVAESADFFALDPFVIYFKHDEGLKVMICEEAGVRVIFEHKLTE